MPRQPRVHVPGGLSHAILRGNHRQTIFSADDDYRAFQEVLRAALDRYGARLHANCWMPNHVHQAVQVGEPPLGRLMHLLASRYSRWKQRQVPTTTALKARAHEHRYTVMIGRTHGIHAEPTTFGLKLTVWHEEGRRNLRRLKSAIDNILVGKISGAVGTFAHLDPSVEESICGRLGLRFDPISTQIVQRDRHAEFLSALAIIAASLEKIATEIRGLQRTEIREVEEYFSPGQKGSSAMPHKRNPVTCEQICGLARVVRSNLLAGLENVTLWHERDISHSAVERIILPDSVILVDYMLSKTRSLIEKMFVYPQRMLENLSLMKGLIFSGQLLLDLTHKGVTREDAYRWVQRNAMRVWNDEGDFKSLVLKDEDILKRLSPAEIERAFDLKHQIRHVDYIYERVFQSADSKG